MVFIYITKEPNRQLIAHYDHNFQKYIFYRALLKNHYEIHVPLIH